MKKYLATIIYAFDNLEQFEWFEATSKILLNRNKKYENKFSLKLIIDGENFSLVAKVNEFKKNFYKNWPNINLSIEDNMFDISKNKNVLETAMIWWVYFPMLVNDSEYLIALDNDTFPNVDILDFINDLQKQNDKSAIWKRTAIPKGKSPVTNLKMSIAKAMGYENKIDESKIGNGGVILVNINNFRKHLNIKHSITTIDDYRTIINTYTSKCFETLGRHYYSDEAFVWLYFDEVIFNKMDHKYNITQFSSLDEIEELLKKDNWIIHIFIKEISENFPFDSKKFDLFKILNFKKENSEFESSFIETYQKYMTKTTDSEMEYEYSEKFCHIILKTLKELKC